MKRFIAVILMMIVMTSCVVSNIEIEQTEEYKIPYATDVDGQLVPVHENVEESTLDPKLFYLDENERMQYNSVAHEMFTGIDVSIFQGDINWNEVAADGIDFVMLRAGFRGYGIRGIMQVDENLKKNYEGAKQAGLKVGVYFYSQAISEAEAIEEAHFLLNAIKGMDIDFPVAYDWEYVDNDAARTNNMTSFEITNCANAFCNEIIKYGYQVIIYFNCEIGYFEYDLNKLQNFDFWLAEYNEYPTFIYDYKMWQYTDKGNVNGIDGNVDINISLVDFSKSANSVG